FTRSGALPSGVTFNTTTGVLAGTPAAGTGGVYPLTIGAVNGVLPNASQSFTLTVNGAPAITSANATTFTVGVAGSFTVTTTGFPIPTRSESGFLPAGVTFIPATGVLAGMPGAGTGGIYALTFTATNGVLPNASQGFALTVNQAPVITSPNNTTCVIGILCSFSVTASGFPTPTFSEAGALPFGMGFDTSTGVLSGVPGSSGTFPLTLGASNGVAPPASQNFTLTVNTVSSGAPRSWVASFGADANPCTVISPCRSFDRAISTTVADGEVVVLDSAGYGPATITRPISIVSPPGIHAGVSVTSGTGIVVNVGAGGRVVLRGLTISAQGGAIGVDFQSGAALYVERSTITNFGTAGLNAANSSGAAVYLRDVKVRDNATGAVFGPTPASTGALTVEVDRSDFEGNAVALSFEGKNTAGVIRSSALNGGTAGIVVQPTVGGATAKIEVRNSTISKNATVAVQAGSGAAGASSSVTLVGVQVTSNGTGLLAQAGGAMFVTDSTVTKNATGISLSGGLVTSLGDNRLVDNVIDGVFSSTAVKQ
ncbi:MAG: Ig domain-containing protein, partial [Casimicrobiaceae bacterium]